MTTFSRLGRGLTTMWALGRLEHANDPVARAIAAAVRSTRDGRHHPESIAWFARLESLRGDMERSVEEISRVDYGAGSGSAQRSEAEMAAGVTVVDQLGRIARTASKPPFWCRLLFELTRELGPRSSLELGTAVGISAAYQAAAMELNGQGGLTTLDGAASLAAVARRNLESLGLTRVEVVVGRFQDTLTDALARRGPFDFVFIDGHHDEQATVRYFEQIRPALVSDGVVLFDDIAWSPGMQRAWSRIAAAEGVRLAIEFGPVGLTVVRPDAGEPRHISLPLAPEKTG